MSFTYDTALLSGSDLMQVRLLVGDTDSATALMQDEEIQLRLDELGSVRAAAAAVARDIAAAFARKVTSTVGRMSRQLSDLAKQYRDLAKQIEQGQGFTPEAFAGGLSKAGKQLLDTDADLVQPDFTKRMDENHRTGRDGLDPNRDNLKSLE